MRTGSCLNVGGNGGGRYPNSAMSARREEEIFDLVLYKFSIDGFVEHARKLVATVHLAWPTCPETSSPEADEA